MLSLACQLSCIRSLLCNALGWVVEFFRSYFPPNPLVFPIFDIRKVLVVVVVVVVFFYFPSEASTVMNTTLKRADNRVEGCGVRKIIIIRDI